MDDELKELEEEILKNKTPEEQKKLKKQWEQNKIETEQKLKKESEKLEKEREEIEKRESELFSIEYIRNGLNEIVKELDDNWNETLQSAIEELCKGKTKEEQAKIMKSFENSFANKGDN